MNNITEQQIENIVEETFLEIIQNKENIMIQFAKNLKIYQDILENNTALKDQAVYLACIKTSQDNMLDVIKESLKKLLINT